MAPEHRHFEKALARHLRAEPTQPSDCADAEILAAYHERLLAPHELAAWKEHIAGCARCQEILAQLEATDEIPVASHVEQQSDQRVLVMSPLPAVAQSAAPQKSAPQTTLMRAAAPSARPRRSFANWRYVVPAGAIAAGLLVWIASREDRLPETALRPATAPAVREYVPPAPARSATDAAKNKAQNERATPALESKSVGLTPRLAAPAQKAPQLQDELRAGAAGTPAIREEELDRKGVLSSDLHKQDTFKGAQRGGRYDVEPSNRVLQQQANNAVQQQQSDLDEAQKREAKPSVDLKQDAPAFDDGEKRAAAAPVAKPHAAPQAPAPPPPLPGAQPAEAGVGGVARKKGLSQDQNAETSALSAQTEMVAVTGEAAVLAASLAQTGGLRILPVPGTRIIWKIDDDGRVRRTTDLGGSWKVQDTGVSATLFSGSAPSEKVCWLVGTFGTVLLTTDGGVHWTKVNAPINSTIDRIEATDARHAVITLQSSTVQFETFDAGQTWSLLKKK